MYGGLACSNAIQYHECRPLSIKASFVLLTKRSTACATQTPLILPTGTVGVTRSLLEPTARAMQTLPIFKYDGLPVVTRARTASEQ